MNSLWSDYRRNAREKESKRLRPVQVGLASSLLVLAVGVGPANADPDTIVHEHRYWDAVGTWNGYKVFLSSPRHSNSGSKGECENPGYEENVNGRWYNWHAATGNWYAGVKDYDAPGRNLQTRGYKVAVSRNSRDNNYANNRDVSRNWNSDIHIISHSNGTDGCPSPTQYVLTMYEHDNDERLAKEIGPKLDTYFPGPLNMWQETGLLELETNADRGDAYVELQFHDNRSRQTWLHDESHKYAFVYGWAVDVHLDYP